MNCGDKRARSPSPETAIALAGSIASRTRHAEKRRRAKELLRAQQLFNFIMKSVDMCLWIAEFSVQAYAVLSLVSMNFARFLVLNPDLKVWRLKFQQSFVVRLERGGRIMYGLESPMKLWRPSGPAVVNLSHTYPDRALKWCGAKDRGDAPVEIFLSGSQHWSKDSQAPRAELMVNRVCYTFGNPKPGQPYFYDFIDDTRSMNATKTHRHRPSRIQPEEITWSRHPAGLACLKFFGEQSWDDTTGDTHSMMAHSNKTMMWRKDENDSIVFWFDTDRTMNSVYRRYRSSTNCCQNQLGIGDKSEKPTEITTCDISIEIIWSQRYISRVYARKLDYEYVMTSISQEFPYFNNTRVKLDATSWTIHFDYYRGVVTNETMYFTIEYDKFRDWGVRRGYGSKRDRAKPVFVYAHALSNTLSSQSIFNHTRVLSVWQNRLGVRSREDGPAVITELSQVWYSCGRKHREHGPAVIEKSGRMEWWTHGMFSRAVGP